MRAWGWSIGLLALAGILLGVAMPWTLTGRSVRAAIEAQIEAETGLVAHVDGRIVLKLLPQPRLRLTAFSAAGRDGVDRLDASSVIATIEPLSFVRGHWQLGRITLLEPTVTLDLDAARRIRPAATRASERVARLRVVMRSGVVRVRSSMPVADTLVTDLDAVLDRETGEGGLAVVGTGTWHGSRTRFALRLDHPAGLGDEGGAMADVRLQSPLGNASATGTLAVGSSPSFSGRLAVATAAFGPLRRAFGLPALPAAPGKVRVGADARVRPGDATFSSLVLDLDAARLEGSLAYRTEGERGRWQGTLATEALDLDTLLPPGNGLAAAWFSAPAGPAAFGTDVDLRFSAAALTAGHLAFSDVAVGALLRGRHLELTLEGARAYGGDLTSRIAATFGAGRIEAHAECSVDRLDLGPLAAALGAGDRLAGTLVGRVALDGAGDSPSEVLHRLSGEGRASVVDGNFTGLSVAQLLRRFRHHIPHGTDLPGNLTSFASADATLRIADGIVSLVDGRVVGPGMRMSFGGRSDPSLGSIDIQAVAAQTDPSGALLPGGARFPFGLRGAWGGTLALEDRADVPLFALPRPSDLGP